MQRPREVAVRVANRIPNETFPIVLGGGHKIIVTFAYAPSNGEIREITFAGREKSTDDGSVDMLLRELGIKLSRAIQGRDPETGNPME